jgi:hypothetical protein
MSLIRHPPRYFENITVNHLRGMPSAVISLTEYNSGKFKKLSICSCATVAFSEPINHFIFKGN